MPTDSYPWSGVAPADGADAGPYTAKQWWAAWVSFMQAGGILVEGATALRTLAAYANRGVFYAVQNRLEVTDGGGLDVQVDTGAALVDGQFVTVSEAVDLTLPASQTDWYVVLRKNYTGSEFTPTGWVSGEGKVPAYTTRPTWVSSLVQSTDRSTYWDIPLAIFSTNAADITALTDDREYIPQMTPENIQNRTRTFFVPVAGGAEAASIGGSYSDTGILASYSGALLPSPSVVTISTTNNVYRCRGMFKVPSDYNASMTIQAVVRSINGVSLDVYGRTSFYAGEDNEDFETHTGTTGFAAVTLGALEVNEVIQSVSVTGIGTDDFVVAEWARDTSNVADTHSIVAVLGFLVSYTADS